MLMTTFEVAEKLKVDIETVRRLRITPARAGNTHDRINFFI